MLKKRGKDDNDFDVAFWRCFCLGGNMKEEIRNMVCGKR